MEEMEELLKNLLNIKNAEKVDTPLNQEMVDRKLLACKQKDHSNTPPPDITSTTRKIPEGSTVRRRLFADDGLTKPSTNPNMINSADDVERMMQEEVDRAAIRWNFDITRGEPIPIGTWSWLCPSNLRGDNRKRRMQDTARRPLELNDNQRNKLRKVLVDPYLPLMNSMAVLDNITNSLMDDSRDCYAESVQHWNFDFDNKMPAEGAVVWEQVGSHWVGNKPATFTRLVLYPTETEKEESNEEITKETADEPSSALKPTDKIEHLFTDHVNVIYGDWKREMTDGIKTATIISARQNIDIDILNDMRLLQATNQHQQITKSKAIAMIRGENPNQQNDATVDRTKDNAIREDNNSTPKKSPNQYGCIRKE